MPKESTKLKNPIVRITRSLRKRLESIDSDSERSNTPVNFDSESNKSETSPNSSKPSTEKDSVETPIKITRKTQSDAVIGSPLRRRLRRAGSVPLDDNSKITNQYEEIKSSSVHQQTPAPARKIITRRSSVLLNESVDLTPVSSPSKKGRKRKVTLLDTCVPEEDTNDFSAIQNVESYSKSPENLKQIQNNEIVVSNELCPAYCTRSRSKSPNSENDENQEINKELIEKNHNKENVKQNTTDSNMDTLQETNEDKEENTFDGNKCPDSSESNFIVLKFNDDICDKNTQSKRGSITSISNLQNQDYDDDTKDLSQLNQSPDKVEVNISKEILRTAVNNEKTDKCVIDLDYDVKNNEEEHKAIILTLTDTHDDGNTVSTNNIENNTLNMNHLNGNEDKSNDLSTVSDKIEISLEKHNHDNAELLNKSSKMSDENLEDTECSELNNTELSNENFKNFKLNKMNQIKLDEAVKEYQDIEKTNISKSFDLNHHTKDENVNMIIMNDKKDKENIEINNTMLKLTTAKSKYGDIGNPVTPFKKRMSSELTASSTPIIAAKLIENDSSKFELSATESNTEKNLKKCFFKKRQSVISHSQIDDKLSNLPKTPIPSKSTSHINSSAIDLSFKERESIVNKITNNSVSSIANEKIDPKATKLNLSECNFDKLNNERVIQIDFAKSWSHAIKGSADTTIDAFGLKKYDTSNINHEDDMKTSKNITSSNKSDNDDDENLEKSDNDESNDEEEKSKELNEFIDNEALEVDSSVDSLDTEEKEYLKQNEIPEYGESIGSQDTDEEQHVNRAEESDDMDSFIVSDEQETSVDDYDNSECESRSDISGVEKEKEKTTYHKRKPKRISSSSEEDELNTNNETIKDKSGEDEEGNPIDIKNNEETNNKVKCDQYVGEEEKEEEESNLKNYDKEIEKLELNMNHNSDKTVDKNESVPVTLKEMTFSESFSKSQNIKIYEEQVDSHKKQTNLLSKSISIIDEFKGKDKQDNSSQKQTRHSLPARENFFTNLKIKSSETEVTKTTDKVETEELYNENCEEEASTNSFILDGNPKCEHLSESSSSLNLKGFYEDHYSNDDDVLSNETTNGSDNVENEKNQELQISLCTKNQSAMDTNSITKSKKEQSTSSSMKESFSNKIKNEEREQNSLENGKNDLYERISEQRDEILEAASETIREVKLLSKNKSGKTTNKTVCENDKMENLSRGTAPKQEKLIEKALKFSAYLLSNQTKPAESVHVPKYLSKKRLLKTELSTEKRLPEEIVNAIDKLSQSDKEKTKRKLSRNEDETESNSGQDYIKTSSGSFLEEPLTPKKLNKPKLIKFPWGIVREEPITQETKKLTSGFKEVQLTPKSSQFRMRSDKSFEKSRKHKNDVDVNKSVQYSWGTVREEPLSRNLNKATVMPKSLAHKVKKALSTGQIEPPIIGMNNRNKQRKVLDPLTVLPKPAWIKSEELQLITGKSEKVIKKSNTPTDFIIKPLTEKKRKRQIDALSEQALEFKKRALLNKEVPRETSKQLLQKKDRQRFYNF